MHVFILFNISSQEMVKVILNFVHYYKSLYYSKHNCSGPNNSSNVLNLIVLILIKRQQKAVQKWMWSWNIRGSHFHSIYSRMLKIGFAGRCIVGIESGSFMCHIFSFYMRTRHGSFCLAKTKELSSLSPHPQTRPKSKGPIGTGAVTIIIWNWNPF